MTKEKHQIEADNKERSEGRPEGGSQTLAMPASFNAELVDGDHMDPLKGWVAALQHKIKKQMGRFICSVPSLHPRSLTRCSGVH